MDQAPKAPKPLTEAQRNEVRTLLKQLSAVSASRRSKAGNRNPLSRKKIKKVKRIENPFESIEEGNVLTLHHEHDGRDLELEYAERVVDHISTLWGDVVKLITIIEDEPFEI